MPKQAVAERSRKKSARSKKIYEDRLKRHQNDWALGRRDAVKSQIGKLAAQFSDDADFIAHIGDFFRVRREYAVALQYYNTSLRISNANHETFISAAYCLIELNDPRQATPYVQAATKLAPNDPETMACYAALLTDQNRHEKALEFLKTAVEAHPKHEGLRRRLSKAYSELELKEDAIRELQVIARQKPHNPGVQRDIGRAYLNLGDKENAKKYFKSGLVSAPGEASILNQLLQIVEIDDDEELTRHAELLDKHPPPMTTRGGATAQYVLGLIAEKRGDYEKAFTHFKNAADARRRLNPESGVAFQRSLLSGLRKTVAEAKAKMRTYPDSGFTPIFIIGMPRSGTTLLERIFASDENGVSVGEKDYFSRLPAGAPLEKQRDMLIEAFEKDAPGKRYVVNSAPMNFTRLIFMKWVLPDAKYVWTDRHPMACAWSCFKQDFGSKALNWCDDFDDLGEMLALQREFRAFMREDMELDFEIIRYEKLVSDFEATLRPVVETFGLEWGPHFLEFHKTKGVVKSASIAQVRRSLYTSSMEEWRRYEPHLGPLKDALRRHGVSPEEAPAGD